MTFQASASSGYANLVSAFYEIHYIGLLGFGDWGPDTTQVDKRL